MFGLFPCRQVKFFLLLHVCFYAVFLDFRECTTFFRGLRGVADFSFASAGWEGLASPPFLLERTVFGLMAKLGDPLVLVFVGHPSSFRSFFCSLDLPRAGPRPVEVCVLVATSADAILFFSPKSSTYRPSVVVLQGICGRFSSLNGSTLSPLRVHFWLAWFTGIFVDGRGIFFFFHFPSKLVGMVGLLCHGGFGQVGIFVYNWELCFLTRLCF